MQPIDHPSGEAPDRAQVWQVPKTSMVCWTSENPCSRPTRAAHDSTESDSTSTVVPHARQTR